jgi:hypothetical protein
MKRIFGNRGVVLNGLCKGMLTLSMVWQMAEDKIVLVFSLESEERRYLSLVNFANIERGIIKNSLEVRREGP